MHYFKKQNEVYAFDNDQLDLVTDDFIAMSDDEIDRHIHPEKYYTDEQKTEVKAQENLIKAQSEYERISSEITSINNQLDDEDYSEHTQEQLIELKAKYTSYRIALRAFLKTDGNSDLPII